MFRPSPLRRVLHLWDYVRERGGWYGYAPVRGESDDRWEPGDPPEEAYGRVTNPERFQPLHSTMLEIVDGLEEAFDLDRTEGYGLDEELEGKHGLARPSIRLTPADSNAAPITVVFTDFPGLMVRLGRWFDVPFLHVDAMLVTRTRPAKLNG